MEQAVAKQVLLKEVATAADYWIDLAASLVKEGDASRAAWLEEPEQVKDLLGAITRAGCADEFRKLLAQTIYGFAHSLLVAFDGGAPGMGELEVDLVERSGQRLSGTLHEEFTDYLFETGRRS